MSIALRVKFDIYHFPVLLVFLQPPKHACIMREHRHVVPSRPDVTNNETKQPTVTHSCPIEPVNAISLSAGSMLVYRNLCNILKILYH